MDFSSFIKTLIRVHRLMLKQIYMFCAQTLLSPPSFSSPIEKLSDLTFDWRERPMEEEKGSDAFLTSRSFSFQITAFRLSVRPRLAPLNHPPKLSQLFFPSPFFFSEVLALHGRTSKRDLSIFSISCDFFPLEEVYPLNVVSQDDVHDNLLTWHRQKKI